MRIDDGNSHRDMVQDLLELAVLGEKYPRPLTQINFNVEVLQTARTLSFELRELLASVNGSADSSNETKLRRDQAFTLLANKVSLIREYGRYVFHKDEEKKERYYNNY